MFKKMFALVVVVLLFAAPASAQNLLNNFSFENGIAQNWTIGGPNWQAENVYASNGTIAAMSTIGSLSGQPWFANLKQNIPVAQGQTVYAKADVATIFPLTSFASA